MEHNWCCMTLRVGYYTGRCPGYCRRAGIALSGVPCDRGQIGLRLTLRFEER
jgi:hypothetical protein